MRKRHGPVPEESQAAQSPQTAAGPSSRDQPAGQIPQRLKRFRHAPSSPTKPPPDQEPIPVEGIRRQLSEFASVGKVSSTSAETAPFTVDPPFT